jgi:hypothetical protein
MDHASCICFKLVMQETAAALAFAFDDARSNSAAKMAMIAITTSNSIRVNPRGLSRPLAQAAVEAGKDHFISKQADLSQVKLHSANGASNWRSWRCPKSGANDSDSL